jgi:hypothetical protein
MVSHSSWPESLQQGRPERKQTACGNFRRKAMNFSSVWLNKEEAAGVRSWEDQQRPANAGSLSPNSVAVVVPIAVVSAHEEDCTIRNPRPFDRVAAYNTRANQKGQVALARAHGRQRSHFAAECCISG